MSRLSGGPGRLQDPAEEVDHIPESPSGVFPPGAPRLLQQPEGSFHAAGAGLEGDNLLRDLPRPVVSGPEPTTVRRRNPLPGSGAAVSLAHH